MGKKTKLAIDLNQCRALDANGNVSAPELYGNGGFAYMAYAVKDGELMKVFNRTQYTLEVSDLEFEFEATEQQVSDFISSYKHNFNPSTRRFEADEKAVDYSGVYSVDGKEYSYDNGFTLPANSKDSSRSGYINILQPISGLSFECSYTQKAKELLETIFVQVWDVSVSYDDISEDGGSSVPSVNVVVWMKHIYSDGSEKDFYPSCGNEVVTYASGEPVVSGATINEGTGVVSVGENSDTSSRNVFKVQFLSGTMDVPYLSETDKKKTWNWRGSYVVGQMPKEEDYIIYVDETWSYSFSSSTPSSILATDEIIPVSYSGRRSRQYYWASNPSNILTETENLTMYLTVSGVSGMTVLDKNETTAYVNVGKNSSASEKSYRIRVYYYDTNLYDEYHDVTQAAADVSEHYEAPTLNSAIELEEIGFDGSRKSVYVPIRQRRYKYNEVTGDKTYLEDYTTTVLAAGVGGRAESGTGFSFSNGYVSADSMGRTEYKNGRKVYTLTSVFVDGIGHPNHEIPLGGSMEIRQAANNKYTSDSYVLSVSASPASGIPALGGTSIISYSAQIKTEEWYDADPSVSVDYTDTSASLSTTIGSIASSVSGSGTTTLNLNSENFGGERNVIVTLSKGNDSDSCSVTQNAADYKFGIVGEAEKNCNAEASVVTFSFESSRNGKVWQPDFSVDGSLASIGNISLSGTIYTVQVNVKANTDINTRNIVVTATQSRWSGSVSLQTTITQAGASTTVVRTINAYGTWNLAKTKISPIYAFLNNESGSSVTFTGIKVELRRRLKSQGYNPESAELVTTVSYSDSVYVGANSSKNITISDITHTGSNSYYYWLSAYATQTTKVTYNEIEEAEVT